MSLGEFVAQERAKRGLTAKELARRSGVSITRLQEIETGISRSTGKATKATMSLLIKLSRGLDVPLPRLAKLANLDLPEPETHDEAEIIGLWRSLTSENRAMAVALLRAMKDQQSSC